MGEAFWHERCPDCDGHGGNCQRCGGTGDIKIVVEPCPHCEGEGSVTAVCPRCDGRGFFYGGAVQGWPRIVTCGRCQGQGTVWVDCPECGGSGELEEEVAAGEET